MSVIVNDARIAIAESIKARQVHLAWGSGDGAWTTPPSEPLNATVLLNEIGRRKPTEITFGLNDPAGDINTSAGRFSKTTTPTNILVFTFSFDYLDASAAVIRETGLFIGGTTNPALPGGQMYFDAADVVTPGRLSQLSYYTPIYRTSATTETFQLVQIY